MKVKLKIPLLFSQLNYLLGMQDLVQVYYMCMHVHVDMVELSCARYCLLVHSMSNNTQNKICSFVAITTLGILSLIFTSVGQSLI